VLILLPGRIALVRLIVLLSVIEINESWLQYRQKCLCLGKNLMYRPALSFLILSKGTSTLSKSRLNGYSVQVVNADPLLDPNLGP
jgi:hypothetical protein